MVDTNSVTPIAASVVQSAVNSLRQLSSRSLTTQQFVAIAELLYWSLLEGEYRHDHSSQAHQLREIFADITTQWECLVSRLHETTPTIPARSPEFPPEWVHHWLQQIQQIEATPMAETPKNQPTFHIGQVGTINTGDVTVQGDQVGIQHNYAISQELNAALQDLKSSLAELQKQHPTVTTEVQAYDVIEAELINPINPTASKLATLRQQLLNPERHLKASKATLAEVAKHYLEESIWAKAFITYLDTMSADPGNGG
jgi:hypothetical protein